MNNLFQLFITVSFIALSRAGYDEVMQDMSWVYAEDWGDSSNYETTSSGLRYKMLAPRRRTKNKGKIKKGDSVKVMYKLYIEGEPEHKHIYSQSTLGESFGLVAGQGGVIKGFDEAVLLMKDGDRGRFMMPYQIAYGESGQAGFGIPPKAELEYFLEVHKEGSDEL
jgi:peptidyl-prolyl cis-trans isomerase A (cyclophilin A)